MKPGFEEVFGMGSTVKREKLIVYGGTRVTRSSRRHHVFVTGTRDENVTRAPRKPSGSALTSQDLPLLFLRLGGNLIDDEKADRPKS